MRYVLLVLLSLWAAPAHAQVNPQDAIAPAANAIDGLFTPRFVAPEPARKYVDWASTVASAVSVAKDTWDSLHAANKKDAILRQTIRDGAAFGVATLLKALVSRERPDGSSNDSWPSEHTMYPALLMGASCSSGGLSFSIPMTIGTGAGRIVAKRHWFTDVASGAGIGWAIGRLTRSCQ